MKIDLDQLLTQLRDAPLDSRLNGIEHSVWARLEEDRLEAMRSGEWGWRAALAATMLCVGVFASGMEATKHRESSPFAIHSTLSPATILEEGR